MKVIQDVESWLRANFKAGEAVDVTTSDSILVISRKPDQPKNVSSQEWNKPFSVVHENGHEDLITAFWEHLESQQFTCETNSITGECRNHPDAIEDREETVVINGEFDKPGIEEFIIKIAQKEYERGRKEGKEYSYFNIHDGRIVEQAIYTRPLNDEEISQIFSGKIFPFLKDI